MPTTSYFKVKNVAAFLEWVESIPELSAKQKKPAPKRLGLRQKPCQNGYWQLVYPGCEWLIASQSNQELRDIQYELIPHLEADAVVVFKETYQVGVKLFGQAVALHSSGGLVRITLDDIYSLARERFSGAEIWPEEEY